MKHFIVVLAVLVILSSCTNIKGNGNIITNERKLQSFNKLEVKGSTEVYFHSASDYRVEVTTDSNLEEDLLTIVKGNVLKIGHPSFKNIKYTKEVVDIYCPNLSSILLSGSTVFKAEDDIKVLNLSIELSGSGSLNANILCESITIDISGSGYSEISGESRKTGINISGSGEIMGANFTTEDCAVDISGSGKVTAFIKNSLNGKISGSGKIMYKGSPSINLDTSGSGGIEKIYSKSAR